MLQKVIPSAVGSVQIRIFSVPNQMNTTPTAARSAKTLHRSMFDVSVASNASNRS